MPSKKKSPKYSKAVEEISLKMGDVGFTEPFYNEGVSEAEIISDLHGIEALELTDRDGRTPLICAAVYGRTDVIAYLLERGAAVNAQDNTGFAPLHAAVKAGKADAARMLLEHNADANLKNAYGNTPIMCGRNMNDPDLYRLLLSYGADPHVKNDSGISFHDLLTLTNPGEAAVLFAK